MASKERNPGGMDAGNMDAIALLMDDHKRVKELFEEFKKFQASDGDYEELKQELMDAACAELKLHARIEEEIFYPAAREALPDEEDLLNEAEVEHGSAKELIAQIEDGEAADDMTCARFTVLGEYIDHHVREEENEMFPKLRKSDMDLMKVGRHLAQRKEELQAEMDMADGDQRRSRASLWDRLRSAASGSSAAR